MDATPSSRREQSLRDAKQRWYERPISIYFMANIAGTQECNNEDKEGRSDIESDREDQAAIPQLKSFKEVIALIELVQHFLECHGMSGEENALSTTLDHYFFIIAAVAINAMVQTTLMIISLHDYLSFQ